ncbi:MAG TPA: hypothetical protein DDW87_11735 [Firmicutes bacterium]|nr:hypothetical protein [Bacillota bacterium]
MAIIPREVWRFCVDQVKLYPLNELAYNDQLKEIKAEYLESGMSGPPDQSGVIVHSGKAPMESKYEAQERALRSPQMRYLTKCVTVMGLVKRVGDDNVSVVLEAIWDVGWRDNALIALAAKTSPATVKRAKHEIVRSIAAGWGLW